MKAFHESFSVIQDHTIPSFIYFSVTQLHSTSLEKRQELLSSESVANSV